MGAIAVRLALRLPPKPLAAFALLLAKTGRAYSQTKSVDTLKHFSLTLTLWLTPGNSQLGEMPSCTSNRHSTGMCLDRPEHPCLPSRRVTLPPVLSQHRGKLEPICLKTRLVCRPCVRGSRPWPCPGSLAQEALKPGQTPAAEPILPGSQAEKGGNAGTVDAKAASDPSSFEQNRRQEVLLGMGRGPDTPQTLTGEEEDKRRGQWPRDL